MFKLHWKSVCSEIIVPKYITGRTELASKENNVLAENAERPMESVLQNSCPTTELKNYI